MEIHVANLSKDYPKKKAALASVTATLGPGMVGLLGDNGAGKTTLMRIITGILRPSSGEVFVDGQALSERKQWRDLKAVLGYLPQDVAPYPNLSVREFLDYMAILKGLSDPAARRRQGEQLIEDVGLTDVADRRVGGFSGGMRRRVGIAQALLGDPRLLVVDEPTAGLDPEERLRFRTLLSRLGTTRTVILSTHILDDVAQTCPEVCVLRNGHLVYAGETANLVEQAQGRTWLYTTAGPPPGDMVVANALPTPAGTQYRLLGTRAPQGAEPTAPTLEDGYVTLMNTTTENR